jgi:carboxypeptidase Q
MKPFRDLGITHISPNNSPGSDHSSFDEVGLPGFRFIQDDIERRAYHTNMDTFDRFIPEDLMQAAVIMASFAYHAAMRDEKFPRAAPAGQRAR